MRVRLIESRDRSEWLRMRSSLWSDCSIETHHQEMEVILANLASTPVFVTERDTPGQLCGFLEASLRSYADGCESSPVGYIEGWYVDQDMRKLGVGAVMVEMAEAWAVFQGSQEMASDCLIDNQNSLLAHLALGYQEAERLIHFRKSLLESRINRKPGASRSK